MPHFFGSSLPACSAALDEKVRKEGFKFFPKDSIFQGYRMEIDPSVLKK